MSDYTAEDVGYVVMVKGSSKVGRPEISDLDAATVRGKRVLLLTDVLCAGETIQTLADEVDRCGGYTKAISGILSFDRSKPMRNVLGAIKRQNRGRVAEWTKQPRSGLAGPPYYEGVQWLSQVADPVYPEAGQCRDCNRGKPYVLLWSGDSHRAVGASGGDPVGTSSQLARSTLSWSKFWLGAQEARSIGQVEHQVSCNHCHDGQVLDISRLREATDLWDEIAHWAGVEIEQAIRARSPADTEPIYLVTSPSRGSTILAGELVRQYEQLQGPHIVTRDPHARLWGSRSSTLPPGRTCILIDDSIFNADTVTGMLTYADRRGCQVLGVLSIFYCARGDDHYELVRTLNERHVPLSAAYVAALQWTDRSRCRSHADFELLKRLASWPGWSSQFRQWFETNLNPLEKYQRSPDSLPRADLLIGRMFRRRQRGWDPHLVRRPSEDDLSMWTQAVADWDEPDNPFDLGPEFAVASTDFGASLDPASAIPMLRQLLQNPPNHRMTLAISDMIDGLPLDLCTQQHEGMAELFEQYRRQLMAAGKPPVDKISVALFKVLWDVNLDKEGWLYHVLTACTESEGPLYGSVLAAVMASQRTSGEIRTTIRRLQTLRDRQPASTADRNGPFVESALRDLDIYRRFRVHEAGGQGHEVAILTSTSDEISVREVDPVAEGYLAANTIFIDFNTSQLTVGEQLVPTKKRHGFETMLSFTALVCLHPAGISTGDLRRFLEPRHTMDDPGGAARQALLTLRNRFGDDGPFVFQKDLGSPWSVTLKDGWKWVILDGPSQNNLASLRAFVEGLE